MRLCYVAVACALLTSANACQRDRGLGFEEKMVTLAATKDDAAAVEAVTALVRYAREHDVQYDCEMRLTDTNEVVPPADLGRHLNDDIEVTIHFERPDGFSEVRWNPPSNGYLAELVGAGGKRSP